ncbi:hypothetical protein CRYUN_Cryun22dG0068800 [Craigia yunnanensis]
MATNPAIKKIEDVTRCQVTFSKRRSSLIRKANEISVFCDVDVALVAFSPSGRISKFCSRERIEDVLERYVKLSPDKRYQEYELENEEDASLAQILWCEKNLKNTLQEINDRKKSLLHETYPSLGQTRPQIIEINEIVMQRPQGQIPFAYNFTGNQVPNRARQNLTSSSQYLMQHDPRTCPYSSRVHNGLLDQLRQTRGIAGVPGASSSFAFNPLAGGFPAIYLPGHPSLTQQTEIPLTYPPIQHQAFYWGQTAPSIQHLQLGAFGNSSMHQPIIGNPLVPFVTYQPLGALGTSNLYQPIMPGILDQQLGVLGSSSVLQLMREDHITPGIPNHQPGALGDSFLDQSLMGDGMTPYVQFQAQQPGVLGSTSVGRHATDELLGAQENPTPTSYHNYNYSNTHASLPPMSQLQVDPNEVKLLYSPTRNLDVTPPLNSERVSSEPFFTNNFGSITTPNHRDGDNINCISGGNNSSNYSNNSIGNYDTTEKHPAGPTQENPPPESPTDSMFLNCLIDEAMMGNDTSETEGNQEDSSMEWDGFTLAENLNLEDLDVIF